MYLWIALNVLGGLFKKREEEKEKREEEIKLRGEPVWEIQGEFKGGYGRLYHQISLNAHKKFPKHHTEKYKLTHM